jgi:hypothetical protein
VALWVLRPLTGLLYQPRMICDGDCGEIGGIKIGRGNRSTWRKPALVPFCPPQIPHAWTRFWTRAVAVGSQRLTGYVSYSGLYPLTLLAWVGLLVVKLPPALQYIIQNYWVSGLCPSSGLLETSKTQRFGNWICFRPQVREEKTPAQLGPLERANLNHWTTPI